MTTTTTAVAIVATVGSILAGPAAHAQAFEGSITMRATAPAPQGGPGQIMEYLVRGGKLRVNIAGPAGSMAMIAVPQEKKMYMLMAAQNAYVEMNLPDAAAAARNTNVPVDDVKVTRTGKMETVAGLQCEHVQVVSKTGATDLCLTKDLGRFVNPMDGLRQGGMAPWQRQIENEFPLKVTMPDGSVPLEVTKIERKRLSNELFTVPTSYTKMAMPMGRPPR